MAAHCRIRTKAFGAALVVAVGLSAPAAAQESQQPVDVTAAPPPNSNTVGPSQLRDFSLGGRPTRPTPAPSTTPTETAPPPAASAQTPTGNRTEPVRAGSASAQPTADRSAQQESAPQDSTPAAAVAGPSRELPLDVVTPGNQADTASVALPEALAPTPTESSVPENVSPWPWLAALFAALGAGAFWWWSRRRRESRYSDPGRVAFAGAGAEVDTTPPPKAQPRVVPTPSQPMPSQPAPVAASKPKPKSDGLITSSALKPVLELRFAPDRMVITDREVIVQFDLVIANVGSASARNILVEGLLVCAGPTQDQEIAQFFRHPRGTGDRIPGIAAMDSLTLKSAVRLPIDSLNSFEAGGRTLFVPLVAFNILYGATDQQVSASFLVGRGKDGDEKLAPFRIDMGPRIFRGLSSRPHSSGLSVAA